MIPPDEFVTVKSSTEFDIFNVPGCIGSDCGPNTGFVRVFFYSGTAKDLLIDFGSVSADFDGILLFAGNTSSPSFLDGTFHLKALFDQETDTIPVTLTITSADDGASTPTTSVAESSSLALLLAGLAIAGITGTRLRKRPKHAINGKIAVAIGTLAALAVACCPAGATEISTFGFVDNTSGNNWTFQLPTNPTPDIVVSPTAFKIFNVPGCIGGFCQSNEFSEIEFFSGGTENIGIQFSSFSDFDGAVLFSGTTSSPSFLDGVYQLTEHFDQTSLTDPVTLTVTSADDATSAPSTSVPESSSLSLFLAGLAIAGITGIGARKTLTSARLPFDRVPPQEAI